MPLLVAALADEDPVFRERVADVLGRMGAAAAPAVSALVARLEPGEEDVRGQIVMLEALGNMGRAAVDATPVLLSYLEDDGLPDDARAAAAEGIFRVVGTTPAAFAACAVALGDQSYEVCTRLIPSLGDLGAEAAPVVPELVGIVLDPTANDGVQRLAMEALGCIGTSDEVAGHALLTIALDDAEEEWVRWSALSALSQLGGDAVGNLLKQLSSAGPGTRCLAVRALAEAKTVAPDTLLALLEPSGIAATAPSSDALPWWTQCGIG